MNIGENMFSQHRYDRTKTTPVLIALSLLLSSLLAFTPIAKAEDISNETYHISMEDNYYNNEACSCTEITILLGDTVIWTNNGDNTHEVYHPDFPSGDIQPGETFTVEFNTANGFQDDRNYNYQDRAYPGSDSSTGMEGLVYIDDGELEDYDEYFAGNTPTYETPGYEIEFSYDVDSSGSEDVDMRVKLFVREDGSLIDQQYLDHVINGDSSDSFSQSWTAPEDGTYDFEFRISDLNQNNKTEDSATFNDIELPYTAGGVNVNLQVKSYGDAGGGVNDLQFQACSKTACNREGVEIKTFDSSGNVVDNIETGSNGRVIVNDYDNGDYTFKAYNNEEQAEDDTPFDEGSFVVNNLPPSENELGTATYQERNSTHMMNYFVVCQGGDSECRGNPKGSLDDAYVMFYSMDDVFVENCQTDTYTGNGSSEHGYACFSDFTDDWEEDFYKFKLWDSKGTSTTNDDEMLQAGNFYYVPLPCEEGDDCAEWFEDDHTLGTGDTDADNRHDSISFEYDAQTTCGCNVDIRVILSVTGTDGGSYGNIYMYQSIYSDARNDAYSGSWQADDHDTYTFHFKLYDNSSSDLEDDFVYSNIELYGPNQAPEIDELEVNPSEPFEGEEMQFSVSATDPEGDDIEYEWDFGDGSAKVSDSSTTHTYLQDGDYSVTLSMKDEHRGYAPDTFINFTVSNLAPEVMDINATGDFVEGSEVSFTADSSDQGVNDILSYSWNFGDDSENVTEINPSHTYDDDGAYTVTLIVCDDSDDCTSTSSDFNVSNIPPTIDGMQMKDPEDTGFQRDNYRVNETVEFAAQINEDVDLNITFTWDFGDGTTSTITYCISDNVDSMEDECNNDIENGEWIRSEHIYMTEGNYTVGLTITDGTDVDYFELHITIDPQPVYGCTDPAANNYDDNATAHDPNQCNYDKEGCTDPAANNYDSEADVDDGTCIFPQDDIWGCMDENAENYNPAANKEGVNSCDYGEDNQTIPDNGDEEEAGGLLEALPGFSLLAVSSMLVLLSILRRRT
ncbi:MAG: hypothetical protein BEU04_01720 [Marine Group III euryarchaeote CG-Bathy1]|uniref:PKD domain-containing protein n=1 Tax=Marine Group III euryarchaeote CG-Bathy1 TaxID=1889001 RepID=A0A1J5TSH3_9ARCH|nr:MAG: hypothetical protein BEU04_01720 [Marine Group III euryarchaeote CG-Bathy1]